MLLRWTLCDYIAWMRGVLSEWVRVDGPNNETRHLIRHVRGEGVSVSGLVWAACGRAAQTTGEPNLGLSFPGQVSLPAARSLTPLRVWLPALALEPLDASQGRSGPSRSLLPQSLSTITARTCSRHNLTVRCYPRGKVEVA